MSLIGVKSEYGLCSRNCTGLISVKNEKCVLYYICYLVYINFYGLYNIRA